MNEERSRQTLELASIEVRRPSRRLLASVLVALAGAAMSAASFAVFGKVGLYIGAIAAAALFPGAMRLGTRRLGASELVVEEAAIRVPALARTVRAADVRSGLDVASERGLLLDLRDGTTVLLRFVEPGFERVAEILGVAPGQRMLTMPLRRALGRFTLGLLTLLASIVAAMFIAVGAGILLGGTAAFLVMVTLPLIATHVVVRRFGSPRVEVGTDGVRVLGLWHQAFVPHREVVRVDRTVTPGAYGGESVVIHRAVGPALHLPLVAATPDRVEGLVQRLEAARVVGSRPRTIAALGRDGRTLDAWRAAVNELVAQSPTFRVAPVAPEDIEAVLADATSTPEHRLGAAMALRAMDVAAGRARIRVVAAATADEHLRAALEGVADGELDEGTLARLTR